MTTIARVAQEAGVGVGTVSRVINGSASVSEATRRRVLDVVAELGYEPNATARALSTGRTRSVGVIAPFFTRPSVIERLRGVAPMLAAAGYQLVLFDVERPEQRAGVFRSVIGRVDGLLSISLAPPKADQRRLAARGHPRRARRPGARRAADRHGRRRRGRPAGHRATCSSSATAGSRSPATRSTASTAPPRARAAASATSARSATRACRCAPTSSSCARTGARPPRSRATCSALASPPTAIFAASDLQALAMLDALEALGARVPDDLSVVGFDDVELARYAGLTTVAQPLEDSGTRGAELLLAALEGEDVLRAAAAPAARARGAGYDCTAARWRTGPRGARPHTATDGMISQSSLT